MKRLSVAEMGQAKALTERLSAQRNQFIPPVTQVRIIVRLRVVIPLLMIAANIPAVADDEIVECKGCFLRIHREAEVAARDYGDLTEIKVEPGQLVSKGDELACLNKVEAEIQVRMALKELEIAEATYKGSQEVQILTAKANEFEKLVRQAVRDVELASSTAADDTGQRLAESALGYSTGEYQRGVEARNRLKASVSEQEFQLLELQKKQDAIRLEKSKLERRLNAIRVLSAQATLEAHQAAAKRADHELQQGQTDKAVTELRIQSLADKVALSQFHLDRRTIIAPFDGIVMERKSEIGEWVDSGAPVFRLVQLHPLAVEGFVDIDFSDRLKRGMVVTLSTATSSGKNIVEKGVLKLISPEVDAVNREVRIQAVVPNHNLTLRPGAPVNLKIHVGELADEDLISSIAAGNLR